MKLFKILIISLMAVIVFSSIELSMYENKNNVRHAA